MPSVTVTKLTEDRERAIEALAHASERMAAADRVRDRALLDDDKAALAAARAGLASASEERAEAERRLALLDAAIVEAETAATLEQERAGWRAADRSGRHGGAPRQ